MSLTYANSGVNIAAGADAVNQIKSAVKATYNSNVLTSLGSFGSAYSLKEIVKNYNDPVLVQSTDGVGTKLIIAKMMDNFITIGQDVVSNNVNDMLCMGAKPITFLDYIGCSKLEPTQMATIVQNMASECAKIGVALVGGEMAEMPGVYVDGEVDVVGMVTGIVEKDKIITGQTIAAGDVVIGLASSGLHTNGFSLARKAIFEIAKMSAYDEPAELNGLSVGEVLLTPHRNYYEPINEILSKNIVIKGMAHITGGGFVENIPRIIPKAVDVEIDTTSYPVPAIFKLIQTIGQIEKLEIYRTLNMGIGMVLVVDAKDVAEILTLVNECEDQEAFVIGNVVEGSGKVKLD
jgi:phosphoribosylformylglycinamidine cyclo-ligase